MIILLLLENGQEVHLGVIKNLIGSGLHKLPVDSSFLKYVYFETAVDYYSLKLT